MAESFLTPQGLQVQRQADIIGALQSAFVSAFGAGIRLDNQSTFGKLVGISSDREAQLWQLLEAVYNAAIPSLASGASLDGLCEITNVTRNPATASTVTLYLAGTPGIVVPAGTLFAVQQSGVQFATSGAVTLGSVGTLAISTLTSASGIATGTTAAPHGLLLGNAVFVSGAVPTAYNGLVTVLSVPTLVTFTYAVAGSPASPAAGTIQAAFGTPAPAGATQTGPLAGPAGTITQIVNAVSGLNQAQNLLDAALGANQESDSALRIRRLAALAGFGNASIPSLQGGLLSVLGVSAVTVYENAADSTDPLTLRPPHSFEAVVQGGANQDILNAIWAKKAAGIATFGNTPGQIVDSQGFSHALFFSRPVSVPVWVVVDVQTQPGVFPTNGAAQIQTAILNFGKALGVGQNVIPDPYLVGQLDSIPGIARTQIYAGPAPTPGTPKTITSLTAVGTTATAVCPSHGFAPGQTVLISGATPGVYDGYFPVASVVDANTFTFVLPSVPGSNASGTMSAGFVPSPNNPKAITALSSLGTTATATSPAHGLTAGQTVFVYGATPNVYNGFFQVATIVDANNFTYTLASAPGIGAGGTIQFDLLTLQGPTVIGQVQQAFFSSNLVLVNQC